MKAIAHRSTQIILNVPFWLAAIASCLVALQLTLVSQYATNGFLSLSLLFWLVTAISLWEKYPTLDFRSHGFGTVVGGVILGLSLVAALTVPRHPSFLVPLQLLPFLGGLGCALLASGFQGFKQYCRELVLLFFLGFPAVILRAIPLNMTAWTAKFSTFCLWYLGFNVTRIDDVIRLPTGSIFVFPDCSGIEMIAYLWSLAVLIGIFLALPMNLKILLSICGIVLGFVINGFRVILLTILVANSQPVHFKFWHEGTGSFIFSVIGALILSGFGYWLFRSNTPEKHPLSGFTR